MSTFYFIYLHVIFLNFLIIFNDYKQIIFLLIVSKVDFKLNKNLKQSIFVQSPRKTCVHIFSQYLITSLVKVIISVVLYLERSTFIYIWRKKWDHHKIYENSMSYSFIEINKGGKKNSGALRDSLHIICLCMLYDYAVAQI